MQKRRIRACRCFLNLEHDNPVFKAIKYMNENYKSSLSIKEISSNLNMSESNLCQYFKKVVGIAPKEYLTNIKMSKAKEMIKRSSITDVAFDLGYENISHYKRNPC
jgi:AraC-like DNA-binding protein